jgi:hypothetical protein
MAAMTAALLPNRLIPSMSRRGVMPERFAPRAYPRCLLACGGRFATDVRAF